MQPTMANFETLITIIALSTSVYGYQITTKENTLYMKAGEDVTLPCQVQGSDYNPNRDVMTWKKKQGQGEEQDVMMLILLQYQGPFANKPRFPSINVEQSGDTYAINPMIKGLKVEDTGRYTCMAGDKKITHTLWVIEQVEEINLWSYMDENNMKTMEEQLPLQKEKLIFQEGLSAFVQCVTKGGIPPPTLTVMKSMDNTAVELATKINETYEGNTAGMKKPSFITMSSNIAREITMNHKADGHTLTCNATVADNPEFTKRVTKTIDMRYKPFFREGDCAMEHKARMGRPRKITCKVMAKPLPSRFFWKVLATGTNIDADALLISDNLYEVPLVFTEVSMSDLGKYQLMVENSVGMTMTDIEIIEGDYEGASGSASILSISILCTLLSAVLALRSL